MLVTIEDVLYPIVVEMNNYLSSYVLIFLLIGVGLWYSVKTRFVQVCYLGAVKFYRVYDRDSSRIYTIIALVFIFLGTLMSNDLVWELTDAFNYLMVIPNALALFALTGMVKTSLNEVEKKNEIEQNDMGESENGKTA